MKNYQKRLLVFIIIILFCSDIVIPCTTFCFQYKGDWIYGRNYDWDVENCLIMVNKRNMQKAAMLEDNPVQWVSKFGSITFNQYGREMPLGGMNEAGLVIECMWLAQTEYPHSDNRPQLQELQWIQYHLDTSRTVKEVIESSKKIRISANQSQPLHFLICDRKGHSVTIEFLEGKMKAHTGKTLPVSALTNNTYEYCVSLWKANNGDETLSSFKTANYSVKRFIWATKGVAATARIVDPVSHAFNILEKVSVTKTMFRIVYDVKNGRIYFKNKSNANIRSLNFKAFDYSCKTPVKILDILAPLKGDITDKFEDYTMNANLDLIRKSFKGTRFLRDTADENLKLMAAYPDRLLCKEQ